MYDEEQWASQGYGIYTWDINEKDIDLEKLKKLFKKTNMM